MKPDVPAAVQSAGVQPSVHLSTKALETKAPEALEPLETHLKAHIPHLHVLFESSPDCLKLIDAEGKLLSMNANGCGLMEIDDFSALQGHDWVDFWPDPAQVRVALKEAETTGFANFQAFCPTAKGTPKWWDVQITRVRNDETNSISFLSSSRDITHLKQVEESLKEKNAELQAANAKLEKRASLREEELLASNSALVDEIKQRNAAETQFETVFESAPIGIVLGNLKGELVAANDAMTKMLGYSKKELLSFSFRDLTHPEDLDSSNTLVKQLVAQEFAQVTVDKRYRHRDGHCIWATLAAAVTTDSGGKPKYIIAQIIDRTEELNAQAALQASKDRLETVLNTMSEGLVVHNADWEIIDCNPSAEAILGLSREQLEGKQDPSIRIIKEDGSDFSDEERYAKMAIKTGEPQRGVMGIQRSCGSTTWILGHSVPIMLENNEVGAVVSSFTDITEMRNATQALQAHSEQLERSNRDLQDFAYVASHDLQEPLRMVSSYVQLLERRYGDQLDDKAKEYMHFAVDGATRMKGLINDLLAYSRVGTQGDPFRNVSSEELLKQVTANLKLKLKASSAELTHDPLPTVYGDPAQLTSVLQNLIGNALKYHADAPPDIHLSAEAIKDEDKDVWRFAVQDKGIGIDKPNLEAIFALFTRLHTRDSYSGNGIGLTICRRILERHGGRIWAESLPGQGATFYFTLPR